MLLALQQQLRCYTTFSADRHYHIALMASIKSPQAPGSTSLRLENFIVSSRRAALQHRHAQRLLVYAASTKGSHKTYDVIALGNMCVDIVTPTVDALPPVEVIKSQQLLKQLTEQASDQSLWEVGGNSNFLIASARLGLHAACIGNLGDDIYGRYLLDNLKAEGISRVEPLAPQSFEEELKRTLLCFVLVDKSAAHAFCSRYDFGPWPLLPGVDSLTEAAMQMLQDTRALMINGFLFDELPADVVLHAARTAHTAGCAVFFDPGPRAWTLPAAVLQGMLDNADVVITTQEEAEVITGEADPQASGWHILSRPHAATRWCFVKLGPSGAILCSRDLANNHWQPALQVPVADTVGCGDSFAAACVLGYIQQAQPQPLLALANAVGAATATGIGAGRNVATANAVLDLLATAESKPVEPVAQQALQGVTAAGRGDEEGTEKEVQLARSAVVDEASSAESSSGAVAGQSGSVGESGSVVQQDGRKESDRALRSEQSQALRHAAAELLQSSLDQHKPPWLCAQIKE